MHASTQHDPQRHPDDHLLGTSCAQHVGRRHAHHSRNRREERLRMVEHVMGEIPREAGDDRCLGDRPQHGAQPLGDRTAAAGRPD
ncbi:hypothetical protein CAB90_02895 [Mycobacterium tuberculosis]|uniref:Uncharacterized protein n=1 Tax=Mycobacterium tuberculosis TaxID=1773 RepID=A0A2I7WA17_MYCTX|nr:hypothetical protein CAB90_02895 [Mycobacterium tuberculosis]